MNTRRIPRIFLQTFPFLTIFFLLNFALAQTDWVVLFQDNFNDGILNGWRVGPLYEDAEFHIEDESGNFILSGSGHGHIDAIVDGWANYSFKAEVKFVEGNGGVHLNYRTSNGKRYFIGFSPEGIYLSKSIPPNHVNLISLDEHHEYGIWYDIEIVGLDNNIKVYVDGVTKIDYNDTDPVEWGGFGLETLENSHIHFDNIMIRGEKSPELPQWVRTGGPWGGIGYDVRIDPDNPDIMYVTDQWAGNHKSVNGGATWYPNNEGIETVFGSTGESVPIFCLSIDPNNTDNIWCGTFGKKGIYRSINKGELWEKKVNGIPDFPCGITFRGIAIRPGNSNVVFCAVELPLCSEEVPEGKNSASRGKIFKTTDFGENWQEVLDSDALVRHILINPDNPDIMYVSTGIFDRDCVKEEGVWKSIDGGETWFHANNELTDLTVAGLFMDYRDPEILWACTGRESFWSGDDTGEIFKTTNGGELWTKVFPIGNRNVWNIHSITTSGSNSNTIYAASEGTFYGSTDEGISWEEAHYNIPGVYTGIPVGIAAHPTDENIVFINSYSGGVFGSLDGGKTWKPYNIGYSGAEMLDIIIDPGESSKALAVGRSGIAKTNDGGVSWEGAGHHPEWFPGLGAGPLGELSLLSINHKNQNSFLCGAYYSPLLLKTTDKFNWDVVYDFRDEGVAEWNHGIGAIQYSYNDSNIIYTGIRYETLPFIIDRPQHYDPNIVSYGVFKSIDGGITWSEINTGLTETTLNIQAIAVDPNNPDTTYAGIYGFGIYKTTDGGVNWYSSSDGIISYLIACIAINPNNTSIIYAGAEDGGLYKSIDGGNSWEARVFGMDPEASIRSLIIDPTNSHYIYAADWRTGIYYSADGGERWWPLNEGLTTRSVQKLAISSDGKTLYAATQGQGVFRLSYENIAPAAQYIFPDNDSTLSLSNEDSVGFLIGAIDLNDDSLSYQWYLDNNIVSGAINSTYIFNASELSFGYHTLYCEISDAEFTETVIWNIEIVDPTIITSELVKIPKKFYLYQNYPNPFNPLTKIKFALPKAEHVKIEVYDLIGQRLEILLDKRIKSGYHEIEFNGQNLSSGIYFYIIETSGWRKIKKMILIK